MPKADSPVELSRANILGWRLRQQQLDLPVDAIGDIRVLDSGIPDTHGMAPAILALQARLKSQLPPGAIAGDRSLAMVWGPRGAPWVIRRDAVAGLAMALAPRDVADLAARAAGHAPLVRKHAATALRDFDEAAVIMRAHAGTGPIVKGDLSGAMTERIAPWLSPWCKGCQVHHPSAGLFPWLGLAAGLEVLPDTVPAQLVPIEPWPVKTDVDAVSAVLVKSWLSVLGPATPADLASWLGASLQTAKAMWATVSGELAEVRVEGRETWLLQKDVSAAGRAAPGG